MAQHFHRLKIEGNVAATFAKAGMKISDIDAVAVTTRPGLSMSLQIGVRYAKYLSRRYEKPIIPIHHMQAHALTARMEHKIDYPFLCFLASGGHCLLVFVKSTTEFRILGDAIDQAPGKAFDMVARVLQLNNLPHLANVSGGQTIEIAAQTARNPMQFQFPQPTLKDRNCQFTFAVFSAWSKQLNTKIRLDSDVNPDQPITEYEDFCAGYLRAITKHMVRQTQRAMEFCEWNDMWKGLSQKRLVFSGGVACNNYIYTALTQLCEATGYQIYRPSKRLCTDNGIMIAWNGVERWLQAKEAYTSLNIDDIVFHRREPIGKNLIDTVTRAAIKCKWKHIPILDDNNVP